MKRISILLAVLVLICGMAMAQEGLIHLIPEGGYHFIHTIDATDSASYYHSYVYLIPEGCKTDTFQLLFYGDAITYDSMDLDMWCRFGFQKDFWGFDHPAAVRDRDLFAWEKDSVNLVTAWTTEVIAEAFLVYRAAADTVHQGNHGPKDWAWHDAILITVRGGGTANGSDVDYWHKMIGQDTE